MGHGAFSAFSQNMVSAATLSPAFDLQRGWSSVYLVIPTMNSNTQLHIQGCESATGTFRRVKHPSINSSTITTNDFAIASSATNRIVPIPNGLRFLKVEATATVDNGATFKIICSDS